MAPDLSPLEQFSARWLAAQPVIKEMAERAGMPVEAFAEDSVYRPAPVNSPVPTAPVDARVVAALNVVQNRVGALARDATTRDAAEAKRAMTDTRLAKMVQQRLAHLEQQRDG